MIMWIGYLFTLLFLLNVIQGQRCQSDRECNRNVIKCGFCVKHYCQFPFPKVYTPETFCNFNTNKCKNESCTVGQTKHASFEGYSICVCECSIGRYGHYCENQGNSGEMYTSGVQLIAPTVINFLEDYSVFITVQEQGKNLDSSPRNISVLLTTTSGVFGAINPVPALKETKTEDAIAFCMQRSWDSSICQFFKFKKENGRNLVFDVPLRVPFWYPKIWEWSRNKELSTIGITHTLLLKVRSEDVELNTYQQQFVVNYANVHQSIIPVPRIYDCGNTIETPVLYRAEQEIDLTGVIYFPNKDVFNETITLRESWKKHRRFYYEWKAFRVKSHSQIIPDYNSVGKCFWKVPPFSWKHGLYIVRLLTRSVELTRTDNYGQCYLQVVLTPLIATISGGVQRVVNIDEELVLDTSSSRDPNQPPGKSKLLFTMNCNWTREAICKKTYRDSLFYDGELAKLPFRYNTRSYKLDANKVYNFTLKVELRDVDYELEPAYAYQLVTIRSFPSEVPLKSFEIECIYNCDVKVNPQDMVSLQLKGPWKILEKYDNDLHWEVFSGETRIIPKPIHPHNIISYPYIFTVSKNSLQENSVFQFKVIFKNADLLAIYELSTSKSTTTNCGVKPTEGIRGITLFNISCNSVGFVDRYEFYDNDDSHSRFHFSGRMLAFQKIGFMEVYLTSNVVDVHTYGEYGIRTITTINLKLKSGDATVGQSLHKNWKMVWLKEMASTGNIHVLRRVITVVELFNTENDGDKDILGLLTLLNMVPLTTGSDAKLCLSTLHFILIMYENYKMAPNFDEASQAAVTLNTISRIVTKDYYCIVTQNQGCQFTLDMLYEIMSHLLQCIFVVLEAGWQNIPGPIEYPDLKISSQVEVIFKLIMDTLRRMGTMLLSRYYPDHDLVEVTSGMKDKFKKEDNYMFAKVFKPGGIFFDEFGFTYVGSQKIYPVYIPEELNFKLKEIGYYVGLQITLLNQKYAVWWRRKIETYIVHVQMCYKKEVKDTCSYPQWLESPIWINFMVKDLVRKAKDHYENVTRMDELKPQDILDLEMKVIKIDLPPTSCLFVYFGLKNDTDELIVLIKKGIRPDYDLVEKEGKVITRKSYVYQHKCEMDDQPQFYYMAILASERVLLYQETHFSFKMLYQRCLSWNGKLREWESKGSLVLKGYEKGVMTCQWLRLSMFTGEVREPPFMVDTVPDFVGFHFTPWSNKTYVLRHLALFTLVFMVIYILAWWTDKHQHVKRFVVVLSDNFPNERNGYLICVMTGSNLLAGTDANIGIRIYGTNSESRVHILRSDNHNVMGWLSEDWFLLFTNRPLGTIETLDIWHDNTGKSPAWFCDSILVFDLKMKNYYIFMVKKWIALTDTKYPEISVKPVKLADLISWNRIFMDHFKSGFRQKHLWIATIFRHPRDPITRTDRLMIILCFVLVTMSTSLILVIVSEGGQYLENKEDLPFLIRWRDIVISFISFVMSTVVAGLVMCMFRKSYKIWYCSEEEEKSNTEYLSCRAAEYIILSKRHKLVHGDLTCHSYHSSKSFTVKSTSVTQFITRQLMQHPLIPVQLPWGRSAVDVNWSWRCSAIFGCLLIVLKSVIVCVLWLENLSPNRIKKWLTVVTLSTVQHVVIYLPLKIIITALVLTFAFDRIIYKDFYIFDPKDCRQKHLYGNVEYLRKIIEERMKPKYRPVEDWGSEANRLKRLRMMKWRNILDFLFTVMFMIVLSQVLSKDTLLRYHTNSHLISMISASRDMNLPSYYTVFNLTQLDNFFHESLSLSLFKYIWYMESLQGDRTKFYRDDWCFDNTHRMIRQPHFRQFRVKQGYCQVPRVMENVSATPDCAAAWQSWSAEDTQVYKPYWMYPKMLDNNTYWSLQFNDSYWSQTYTTNWSYSVNWTYTEDVDFTYYGMSGNSYPPMGYNKSLWGKVMVELSLRDEGWVEHHTRAVLAQVTLYNVNTRYFTQVTMVAEQTIAGEFLTKIVAQSMDVLFDVDFWMGLFIVFAILFIVRISTMINNAGLVGYFKQGHIVYEILVVVFLLISIIYLMRHYLTAVLYDNQYQTASLEDGQFSFYEISNNFSSSRSLLCVVFILVVIHIYTSHLWRFGLNSFNFFCALILSFKTITCLAIIFLLFLTISLRFICYLFSIFVTVVLNPNFLWRLTYLKITKEEQFLRLRVLCFIICIGSLTTTTLMLITFIYEYKKARKNIVNDWSIVNLMQFLTQEIGGFCKVGAPELRKNCRIAIDLHIYKPLIETIENKLMINKKDDLNPQVEDLAEENARVYSILWI